MDKYDYKGRRKWTFWERTYADYLSSAHTGKHFVLLLIRLVVISIPMGLLTSACLVASYWYHEALWAAAAFGALWALWGLRLLVRSNKRHDETMPELARQYERDYGWANFLGEFLRW